MKQKGILLGLGLVFSLGLLGFASNYKLVNGQKDFYYGHISYADIRNDAQDSVVFREGRLTPEIAILNLPVGPGDIIQTSAERRSEIQFDNGTIVRLDLNSRLKIETLMAQSLSTAQKISNLVLEKGQVYVMYKKYNSLEMFQVVTAGAAVKLDHNSVALIRLAAEGSTDVQVERGKAFLLYGADKLHLSRKSINAKQRGVVSAENRVELAEYKVLSDFKAWNESINAHFPELHEGSYLPKPLQKLPLAVFNFAQKFGNIHGEWIWHDLYGYVWRPYLNDQRYPWGTWQPYINGSWTGYGGELFWVPAEPWGWVPYHLGIWMWDKGKGWVWLPGSMFAPAWAVWEFYSGMYSWRPFYLFDWMYGFDSFWGSMYWGGYYGYNPVTPNPAFPQPPQHVIYSIRKDQLKRNDSPSLPMPKEMKKAVEATLAALKRGDLTLLSSAESLPRYSVIIKKQDLLSPRWQEKVVPFDRLVKESEATSRVAKPISPPRSAEASRDALRTIERSQAVADLRLRMLPSPKIARETAPPALRTTDFRRDPAAGPGEAAALSAFRFRDWNPDIRTAIRLGVEISYSSRTNEVACPQLGLSSRHIKPEMQTMGGLGGFSPSGGSSSSSGNPSASGSASHSAGQSHSSGSSGTPKHKD